MNTTDHKEVANSKDEIKSNYFNSQTKNFVIKKLIIYSVFVITTLLGIKFYHHHLYYYDELSAKKFNSMTTAMLNKDNVTANTYGVELLNCSKRTPYPRLAAILLAKINVEENQLDDAIQRLYFVVKDNIKIKDSIWHIGNLRLIKVLLIQNKLTEAKEYLTKGIAEKKFQSRYHELQGDFLLASNETEAAKEQYSIALEKLPEQSLAPWLDLKLSDS